LYSQLVKVSRNVYVFSLTQYAHTRSFMHQLQSAASTIVGDATSVLDSSAVTTSSNAAAPSLNVQLGNIQVSVGGPGGSGVYRTAGEGSIGVQTDGIRDGVMNLFGKMKQNVERGLS
jgi:hypothetical protein